MKVIYLRRRTRKTYSRLAATLAVGLVGAAGAAIAAGHDHAGHMSGLGNYVVGATAANGECINPYWEYEGKMTRREKIEQSRKASPHVSANATIMARDRCGKLVTLAEGTNKFVCIPNVDPVPVPNPACFDEISVDWYKAVYLNEGPIPEGVGVGFMSLGSAHWEIDGVVFRPYPKPEGAKLVRDPPHWMLHWKYWDGKKLGLPSYPDTGDVVIVNDGTPFAIMLLPWDTLCTSERRWVNCLDSLSERGLP